uniref:Pre-mRNA-splicing factor Syf1/CRNKL1-like C-terminal HAT-repeats domain-containing protein n=1 Tax=Brassica campestris TaxID=3711 RepID=M4EW07_BRACM
MVQVSYKTVDHLATLWCEWAEMELRHKNFKGALELMRRATAVPTVEVRRRVAAADGNDWSPRELSMPRLRSYSTTLSFSRRISSLKMRSIYEQAIESGLPHKDVKLMCIKFAELERSLGEFDRSRAVYKCASQYADPRSDPEFWNKWHEFETHFVLPENKMVDVEEAKAGLLDDEMAALERRLMAAPVSTTSDDESDGEDKVEIAQKEVPAAVFGGLARKREEEEAEEGGEKTLGSFLGPKSKAATPAITASSGTPRPNRALQVSDFLLCSGRIATKERVFGRRVVAMKQLENKEERDEERGRVTGGGEDRVATDVF